MSDTYPLVRTEDAYDRLRRQDRLWSDETSRVMDRVGLRPGLSFLDVGCGAGTVAAEAAQRVGPTGRVTGMDVDPAAEGHLLRAIRERSSVRADFIEADVQQLAPPAEPYDIVWTRFLLSHLPDPAQVIGRLTEWVAPGGTLVLQDYDAEALLAWPEPECWAELSRVIDGVVGRNGDPHYGRKLPLELDRAGFGLPDGVEVGVVFGPVEQAGDFVAALYTVLLDAAVRLGVTTQRQGEQFLSAWSRVVAANEVWVQLPELVSVWQRRP